MLTQAITSDVQLNIHDYFVPVINEDGHVKAFGFVKVGDQPQIIAVSAEQATHDPALLTDLLSQLEGNPAEQQEPASMMAYLDSFLKGNPEEGIDVSIRTVTPSDVVNVNRGERGIDLVFKHAPLRATGTSKQQLRLLII
jgi:hypothetical protein